MMSEKPSYKEKIIKQSIASAIIVIMVFGIKSIDMPSARTLSKNIKNTLYYTIDYKEATKNMLDTIKNIPQLWNKDAKDNDENDDNTEAIPEIQPAEADTNL